LPFRQHEAGEGFHPEQPDPAARAWRRSWHHRHGHSGQVTTRPQDHNSTAEASFQCRSSQPPEPQSCHHGTMSTSQWPSPSSPPEIADAPAATPRNHWGPASRRWTPPSETARRPSVWRIAQAVDCEGPRPRAGQPTRCPRRPLRLPREPAPRRPLQRRSPQIRPSDGWIHPPGRQIWSFAPPLPAPPAELLRATSPLKSRFSS
jgi:hypothetical protein